MHLVLALPGTVPFLGQGGIVGIRLLGGPLSVCLDMHVKERGELLVLFW